MRAVDSETDSLKTRPGVRTAQLRKTRLRQLALEDLEARTLMSTVPPVTTSSRTNVQSQTFQGNGGSTLQGNASAPSIAVDPNNPLKMVAVWTRDDTQNPLHAGATVTTPVYAQAAYTVDGGNNWSALSGSLGNNTTDFTASAPQPPLPAITDASVAFDAHDNFYITDSPHKTDYSVGEVLLTRYSFSGGAPSQALTNVVSQWGAALGAAYKPTLAVDANQAAYNDQTGAWSQNDPAADLVYNGNHFGGVYVAWSSDFNASNPFLNSQIRLASSADGGASFGIRSISGGGNEEASAPSIVISQGRPADLSGLKGTAVVGGQVSVVWTDTGVQDQGRDRIMLNTGQYLTATTFSTGQIATPITEAIVTGTTPTPQTTSIPLTVSLGGNFRGLTKLTATVALKHSDLTELLIQLQAPDGTTFTLMNNAVDPTGALISPAQGPVGATKPNLGVDAGGNALGTVFDDGASASIDGVAGGPATVGSFRADGGLLTQAFNRLGNYSGTWHLLVTDERPDATPGPQAVNLFSLSLTGSTTSGENQIGTTFVHGVVNGGVFPNSGSIAATPNGFGPAPVLASDNTLGPFSPNSGRLYVAYVDNTGGVPGNNPAPNKAAGTPAADTSIQLLYSDDGGATWRGPVQVSDANGNTDGASEAGLASGRPAFEPRAAVDPTTGALVVSYLDTRDDAAAARVATYVNASLDGGLTWSPGAYANASKTATDAITNKTVNLGPVPDNQSAGNTASRDAAIGLGDHQGLAVFGGNVYPIWASNQNGGTDGNQGVVSIGGLEIVVGHSQTASGPRVVSGTMGPVGEPSDAVNNQRNTSQGNRDNGPEAGAVILTFDRPVDPNSIGTDNFSVTYRDVNGVTQNLGQIATGVSPVAGNANDPNNNGHYGFTQYKVVFPAQYKVGTYSYTVTPTGAHPMNARVRYFNTGFLNSTERLDQAANGGGSGDAFSAPSSASSRDTLPLIVPGPHVVKTTAGAVVQNLKPGATDNEVLNNTVGYIDVTFDRDMLASSFTPAAVLRVMGPAGAIFSSAANPFTVVPVVGGAPAPGATVARTFRVGFVTQSLSGTYTISLASSVTDTSGNPLDENLNAGLYSLQGQNPYALPTSNNYSTTTQVSIPPGTVNPAPAAPTPSFSTSTIVVPDSFIVQGVTVKLDITFGNDPDLKVTLVGPDGSILNGTVVAGTSAVLFQNVGAPGAGNFTGTVFDDTVNPTTPIDNGAAPYFGRYNPHQSLGQNFVTGALNAKGTWTLLVENDGAGAGSLNSWSMTLASKFPGTGLGEPIADQPSLHFRIFVDDPANPLSGNTWTSTGPAPLVNNLVPDGTKAVKSGKIGALAVDPSDPSGNTVYAGGASGGVWKTTNFMTSDPNGPTWIPLTDFGPTSAINVGTITIFPRGADPTKSIVLVGLGEPDSNSGNASTKGYGFLRSVDGGASWELLDSKNNTGAYAGRDHTFSANPTFVYKIAVDPRLNSNQQVIVYAAVGGSGASAGLWRSLDTGTTWQQISNPSLGAATDVVLDPVSGQGVSGGNLQILYAAFPGHGVYTSPNQGQSFFLMAGITGDPLIQDANSGQQIPVNLGPAPTGAGDGKIILAKPAALNSPDPSNPGLVDRLYEGWLYALVVTGGGLDGLYLTKDFGQNWTKVHVPAVVNGFGTFPSNNESLADYGAGASARNVSFAIDPTNPNVVYIGGGGGNSRSGFLRVDATALFDPHNLVGFSESRPDGGALQVNSTGGVSLGNPSNFPSAYQRINGQDVAVAYLNFLRDPSSPFSINSTLRTFNVTGFTNSGAGAKVFTYYPYSSGNDPDSPLLDDSNGQHRLVAFADPLTGHARLILGDDQGVFTGVDSNGTFVPTVGTANEPLGSRNGNLAVTQFYYGAVQPSAHNSGTGNPMSVLFYGGANDVGLPVSGDVLGTGSTTYTNQPGQASPYTGADGNSFGVATDQTGSGTVYRTAFQYGTNFFQVNGVARTFGLTTGPNDPNWFGQKIFNNGETIFGNFAVNPINGNQIIISGENGTIYRTEDQGGSWFPVSDPFGAYAPAVAFGAPDPGAPNGIGNLDNFLYAGTTDGHVFMTRVGGGATPGSNAWTDISNGINDGPGRATSIQRIITNPTRGSREAYAVTLNNVYHTADSTSGQPWQKVTGNLFSLTTPTYGDVLTQADTPQLAALTSIQADWRYQIFNDPKNPGAGTHPVLYVAGDGGAYRSLDNGASWTDFPSSDPQLDQAPVNGGYLPNVRVSDLSIAIGNVNPSSGRAAWQAGTSAATNDPNNLVASTYGRGQFEIRLTPTVITNADVAKPGNIALDPSSFFKLTNDGKEVTTQGGPTVDGVSEETSPDTGMTVHVAMYDLTNPDAPVLIPLIGSTLTDANGHFALHVGTVTDPVSGQVPYFQEHGPGVYTIGLQATDQTGAKGNVAQYKFVFEAPPQAPTNVQLDPASDSGTYNGDQYTFDNNSTTHPAPLFDVSGIQSGATVYLLRATVLNGVVGQFQVVNSVTNNGPAGTVQLADANGGNGKIADTPVNAQIDTAPPQPNEYLYSAYQVDSLNLQSPNYAPGRAVVVDTKAPATPTKITLEGGSDSGASGADSYTFYNNSPQHHAPVFDVAGIEPHATVVLLRALLVDGALGAFTAVNTLTDTAGGTVAIADVNGNNTPIPDNPLGNPVNTASPAGNPYVYKAIQIDLAGNLSKDQGFGNQGAIVIDGTDSDDHGSFGSGANQGGWVYMQKVLPLIAPNVTNSNKIIVALGADPQYIAQFNSGAAAAIESAFEQGPLPALGWSVVFVNSTADIDKYLSGGVAPAFDKNNAPVAGGVSLDQTGLLYITTANQALGDLSDTELAVVNKHGADIADYVNSGGGLFAQAESPFTSGVPTWGWLTSIFPGVVVTDLGGGGTGPNSLQITPAGVTAFPGLTIADLSTGPWHNYFSGNLGPLVPAVTDLDDNGVRENLILTSAGIRLAPVQVIYDSVAPATSVLTLDPTTTSGPFLNSRNDPVTNFNNNPSPGNAPLIDVTGVEPNGVVTLWRTPVNPQTGVPTGAAVLVNTVTQAPGGAVRTLAVADLNGGKTIPDGTYDYTAQQTDLAGNVGATSQPLEVQILATPPAPPSPFVLDPASDTGTFNNDGITKDDNGLYPAPTFDASGVQNFATLELFRAPVVNGVPGAPVLVNTIANIKTGGTVQIADTNAGNGPIPDGTYVYYAEQLDQANNPSVPALSKGVTVTIDSDGPQLDPPATPLLDPVSQTGPLQSKNITQDNNGNPFPAPTFDVGTAANPVETGATVQLFRAPADRTTGLATGPAVLVNTLVNTAGGTVKINDVNGNNSKIPDGFYLYTSRLTDLAGVAGSFSKGTQITVLTATPAVPLPFLLDPASDTGYSQTDGITQVTLFHAPVFDAGGNTTPILAGATLNLFRAPADPNTLQPTGPAARVATLANTAGGTVQIADSTNPADGEYVYTVQQIDLAGNPSPIGGAIAVRYDTSQPPTPPAPKLDPASTTGPPGSNQTSNTSPYFDADLTLTGFKVDSSVLLVRDGSVVAQSAYNLATGLTRIQDVGPVAFGTHTYKLFLKDQAGNIGALSAPVVVTFASDSPGSITLDAGSDNGVKGDNITNVPNPTFDVTGVKAGGTLRLLRNGLTVTSIATGAGGTLMITDKGPLSSGKYSFQAQQVDALGDVSPAGPALLVTIDTTVPAAPSGVKLDPSTDSGVKGDGVTNSTAPAFDASGIVPGATVYLLRNGAVVAFLTSQAGGNVVIADPGPAPNGLEVYKVQQVNVAGGVSQFSAPLGVTIDTSTPAGPKMTLDPASDSGVKGDGVTNSNSPTFDVTGAVSGASLQLFRNGQPVQTVPNVGTVTPGTLVQIQAPGPLADGIYTFTLQQTTLAGTPGPVGAPLVITISTAPPATPSAPQLYLDPSTDSGVKGDDVTNSRLPVVSGFADPNDKVTVTDQNGKAVGTTAADGFGNFSLVVPNLLFNGTYAYRAQATDSNNKTGPQSAPLLVKVVTVDGDYTGSGKTSLATFQRVNAALMQWNVRNFAPIQNDAFGTGVDDVPVTGDFNGGGRTDPVLYRPSTGAWFIQNPGNGYNGQVLASFGGPDYIPVPGNYNATGVDVPALFKTTTGQFFVLGRATQVVVGSFQKGDLPAPGDYDGVGKDEFAIYRPSDANWYIFGPNGVHKIGFGGLNDIPEPGAYDASASSQAVEPAFWRPSTATFYVYGAGGVHRTYQFVQGDIPAPGDYDGIGVDEPAVFRPNVNGGGQFLVWGPNDKAPRVLAAYGATAAVPLQAPYAFRALKGASAGGGIQALSVSPGGIDFGAAAAGLSSPAGKTTFAVAQPPASASAAAPAPVTTAPAPTRARPNQAAASPKSHGHQHLSSHHAVDHALASLTHDSSHKRRPAGH